MVVSVRVTFYTLLLSILPHVYSKDENITESCMHLYEEGVKSYLDNSFTNCVRNFENALYKYKDYTSKLQNCRIKCREEAELSDPLYPVDIDSLLFYERAVKSTWCILQCKHEHRGTFGIYNINRETERLFENRKPYEYLHICYFQNKQLQKAASAAFTYLVHHPDDKVMQANLKHYSTVKGVDLKEVVNFEAKDYVYLYIHAADAYEKKDWPAVIQNMEESLIGYLQAEEECRAQCEGPFDQGWYPDFIPSIANHFTFCLKCKQKCKTKLNSLNGEKHDDLLPSHYHYLQFAYFKQGDLKAACAAVASYLLFYPDDETMLSNMRFYSKLPKGSDDLFTPRPEAIRYVQRQTYEQRLIKFIFNQFKARDPIKVVPEAVKYRVIMREKQLGGPKRFVSDGLATRKQCTSLVDVAKMFAILGDGYKGKGNPHTALELFQGFTLNRASLLVYVGLLDFNLLELFLTLTEESRLKVISYFNIKKNLYFTYTHLVCRSALHPESSANRTDFSHAIHADNCNLHDNSVCEKEEPAYFWRSYSAIIYLNDEFEGGEFVFSADATGEKVQSTIKPKCGRMIGFSSGSENLHGVKAVTKGSRCAIGVWFTFDESRQETERTLAYRLLESLRNVR